MATINDTNERNISTVRTTPYGIRSGSSSQMEHQTSKVQKKASSTIREGLGTQAVGTEELSASAIDNLNAVTAMMLNPYSPERQEKRQTALRENRQQEVAAQNWFSTFEQTIAPYVKLSDAERSYYDRMSRTYIERGMDPASFAEDFLTANAIANATGMSRSEVVTYADQLSDYFLGVPAERNMTWGRNIINSWHQGQRQQQMFQLQDEYRQLFAEGRNDDDSLVQRKLAEIQQLQEEIDYNTDATPHNWLVNWISDGVAQVPYMLSGLGAGAIGTAVGAAIGSMIPVVGTKIGATVGNYLGRFISYKGGFSGNSFYEMKQAGISDATALRLSDAEGIINALNESMLDAVSDTLVGAIGGNAIKTVLYPGIFKKLVTKGSIHNFAGQVALYMAGQGTGEFIQEATQSLTTSAFVYAAEVMDNIPHTKTTMQALGKALEEGVAGFAVGMLFGLPGAVLATTADVRTASRLFDKAVATPSREAFINSSENVESVKGMKLAGEHFSDADAKSELGRMWDNAAEARLNRIKARSEVAGDNVTTKEGSRYAKRQLPPERLDGKLRSQTTVDYSDDAQKTAELRIVYGGTTPTSSDSGAPYYGTVRMTVDHTQHTASIDSVSIQPGYEAQAQEMVRQAIQDNAPGYEVSWDTDVDMEVAIRDALVRNNPAGTEAGLTYSAATSTGREVEIAEYASRIRNSFQNLSDSQVNAAVHVLDALAQHHGMSISELEQQYAGGDFFIHGDDHVAQRARGKRGAYRPLTMEQIAQGVKGVIYAGENADTSTFIHELFHFAADIDETGRRELSRAVKRMANENASSLRQFIEEHQEIFGPRQADDLIQLFSSLDENAGWNSELNEAMTSLYEAWMANHDDANLTPEVKTVLQKIADFMKQVYQTIKGNAKLDADVQAGFERIMGFDGSKSASQPGVESQVEERSLFQDALRVDKVSSMESAYEKARPMMRQFDELVLDMARTVGLDPEATYEGFDNPAFSHPVFMRNGLKSPSSTYRKVRDELEGDWGLVKDMYGGTMVFPTYEEARDGFTTLHDKYGSIIPKAKPLNNAGYRDFKLTVEMPNGALFELIIMDVDTCKMKMEGVGHGLYEVQRAIIPILKDEGNYNLTPEEHTALEDILALVEEWSVAEYSGARAYRLNPQEYMGSLARFSAISRLTAKLGYPYASRRLSDWLGSLSNILPSLSTSIRTVLVPAEVSTSLNGMSSISKYFIPDSSMQSLPTLVNLWNAPSESEDGSMLMDRRVFGLMPKTGVYDGNFENEFRYTAESLLERKNNFNKEGLPLAPNGNPSRLSLREWILVRTPSFKKWFGDWESNPEEASKIVDENGEPMLVYHGSPNEFRSFDPDMIGSTTDFGFYGKGFYFSPKETYAQGYGDFVYPVFLNIRNPFDYAILREEHFDSESFSGWYRFYYNAADIFPEDILFYLGDEANTEFSAKRFKKEIDEAAKISDTPFADVINGSAYENLPDIVESELDVSDAELADEVNDYIKAHNLDGIIVDDEEIVVINPNQIKSIDNTGTFDQENNDILFQSGDGRTKITPDLFVSHTLSEDNLQDAMKIGGFVMPSLGITRPDLKLFKHLAGFGNITLIGDSELGRQLVRDKAVYNRDMWSPTFPQPEYRIDKKGLEAFIDRINSHITEERYKAAYLNAYREYDYSTPDEFATRFNHYPAKIAYLEEHGIPVTIKYRQMDTGTYSPNLLSRVKEWDKAHAEELRGDGLTVELEEQLYKDMRPYFETSLQEVYGDAVISSMLNPGETIEDLIASPLLGFTRNDMYKLFSTARRWNPERKVVDTRATEKDIEESIGEADVRQWVYDQVKGFYTDPFIRIGKKKEPFTAVNVLRYMARQKKTGNAGLFYTFRTAASEAAKPLTSLSTLHAAESLLGETSDFDFNQESFRLSRFVTEAEGPAFVIENVTDELGKYLASNSSRNEADMKRRLEPLGFKNLTDEIVNNITDVAEWARTAPRPYFEAKPKRILQLSDFKAAVISDTVSEETVQTLEGAGLNVIRSSRDDMALSVTGYAQENAKGLLFQSTYPTDYRVATKKWIKMTAEERDQYSADRERFWKELEEWTASTGDAVLTFRSADAHRVHIVSQNMREDSAEHPWSVSWFTRSRDGNMYEPFGHQTFETKWEAVREQASERLSYVPESELLFQTAYAENNAEAARELQKHQNEDIVNLNDGIIARYSSTGRDKMLSNKARNKSLANGFTQQEHSTAAANTPLLFRHATRVSEAPDVNRSPDVKSILRYKTPVRFSGTDKQGVAHFLLKETVQHGNRIYSLELLGIEKSHLAYSGGRTLRADDSSTIILPSADSFGNILFQDDIPYSSRFTGNFTRVTNRTQDEFDEVDREINEQAGQDYQASMTGEDGNQFDIDESMSAANIHLLKSESDIRKWIEDSWWIDENGDIITNEAEYNAYLERYVRPYLKGRFANLFSHHGELTIGQFIDMMKPSVVLDAETDAGRDAQFLEALKDEETFRRLFGLLGEIYYLDTSLTNGQYTEVFEKVNGKMRPTKKLETWPYIDYNDRRALQTRLQSIVDNPTVISAVRQSLRNEQFSSSSQSVKGRAMKAISEDVRLYRNMIANILGLDELRPESLTDNNSAALPSREEMDAMSLSRLKSVLTNNDIDAVLSTAQDSAGDSQSYSELASVALLLKARLSEADNTIETLKGKDEELAAALEERDGIFRSIENWLESIASTLGISNTSDSGKRKNEIKSILYDLNGEKRYQLEATAKGSRERGKAIGARAGSREWLKDMATFYPQLKPTEYTSSRDYDAKLRANIDAWRTQLLNEAKAATPDNVSYLVGRIREAVVKQNGELNVIKGSLSKLLIEATETVKLAKGSKIDSETGTTADGFTIGDTGSRVEVGTGDEREETAPEDDAPIDETIGIPRLSGSEDSKDSQLVEALQDDAVIREVMKRYGTHQQNRIDSSQAYDDETGASAARWTEGNISDEDVEDFRAEVTSSPRLYRRQLSSILARPDMAVRQQGGLPAIDAPEADGGSTGARARRTVSRQAEGIDETTRQAMSNGSETLEGNVEKQLKLIGDAIRDIRAQIARDQKKIDNRNEKIASLKSDIASKNRQVRSLENRIRKMDEQESETIDSLEQELKDLRAVIHSLELQMSAEERHAETEKRNLEARNARLKERQQEEREYRKLREYKMKLAKSIFRKWTRSVDFRTVAPMMQYIRQALDPAFRRDWAKDPITGTGTLEIDELRELYTGIEAGEITDIDKEELKARLGARLYNRISGEGAKPLNDWTVEELEQLKDRLDEVWEEGRLIQRAKDEAKRSRRRSLRDDILQSVKSNPKYRDEPELTGTSESTERKRSLKTEMQGNYYATKRMQELTYYIDGGNGQRGTAYDLLVEQVRTMLDNEYRNEQRRMKPFEDAMEAYRQWLKDNGIKESADEILYHKQYEVNLGDRTVHYNLSALAYIYLSQFNQKARDAVAYGSLISPQEKGHISAEDSDRRVADFGGANQHLLGDDEIEGIGTMRYKAALERATAVLNETGAMQIVDAIRDDLWNKDNAQRLFDFSLDVFNQPVVLEDHYLFVHRLDAQGNRPETIKDFSMAAGQALESIEKGFLEEKRTIAPANQMPANLDLFGGWIESMQQQEHLLAGGRLLSDLRATFETNREVMDVIRRAFGDPMVTELRDYIAHVADPHYSDVRNDVSRVINFLRGSVSTAYLGFKLSSVLVQIPTSLAPFFWSVKTGSMLKSSIQMMAHPVRTWNFITERSVRMERRTPTIMLEDIQREARRQGKGRLARTWSRFNEVGMAGLEWVDKMTVGTGWLAKYYDVLDRNIADGMDTEAAETAAIRAADDLVYEVQPVSDKTEVARLFRSSNALLKMFLQFQQSMNVVFNNVTTDTHQQWRNRSNDSEVVKRIVGRLVGYIGAGMILGLVQQGFDDDDNDLDRLGKIAYWGVSQGVDSIPVVGSIASGITSAILTGQFDSYTMEENILPFASDLGSYAARLITALRSEDGPDAQRALSALEGIALSLGTAIGAPTSTIKQIIRSIEQESFMPMLGRY